MPLAHALQLVHVLHLLGRNLEHAAHLWVVGNLLEGGGRIAPNFVERAGFVLRGDLGHARHHGQGHALHHGVKELAFVFKVPVNRAPGQTGLFGDFLQGRARHPALVKHTFSSVKYQFAGN